jgi:hypothetical protein
VEDHKPLFHTAASSNHGCCESGIRPDGDRQKGANDLAQLCPPKFNRIQEIVMAKVIEFYIPKNFRKPSRTVAEPQLGKIIEFCTQTKKSA